MRRASRVILVVAVVGLVVMPTSAGAAGVDNGGCPPERSNWTLEESAEDAYQDELAETIAAGFTLQDILDNVGVANEAELFAFYTQFWDSVDKNGDGAVCMIDFFGFEKKAPWYSNIIDNVLPH